jgi:hypothetical protein
MMPYSYAAVIVFIVVQAVGEAIWAPLFLRYSCEFTPQGREGVYFGLVSIVLFLGKLLGGLSGELMQHYCPARGACAQGYMVWLIVGCVCLSTPLLLLVSCHWTWLRAAGSASTTVYVEMETTTTEAEEPASDLFLADDGSTTTTSAFATNGKL